MNKGGFGASQGDSSKGFGDLVDQGMQFGMAILGQMVSSSAQIFGGIFQSLTSSQTSNCCCEIPPPCWEPNRLGEVTSLACPAGTASVLLRVTNCNTRGSKVKVRTTGQDSGVTITPNELTLGPMERGVVAVSLSLPANAGTGERREVLIWLHGSKTISCAGR